MVRETFNIRSISPGRKIQPGFMAFFRRVSPVAIRFGKMYEATFVLICAFAIHSGESAISLFLNLACFYYPFSYGRTWFGMFFVGYLFKWHRYDFNLYIYFYLKAVRDILIQVLLYLSTAAYTSFGLGDCSKPHGKDSLKQSS